MIVAKIKVDGVSAKTAYLSDIPAGIRGARVEIEYTDAMWSGLSKTVVFRGCCTKDVTNAGTSVIIPADVVAKPGARIMVGVYGVDADNNLAIPTLWAPLGVTLRAADPSGDESTDPSLPVWAQLDGRVTDLEKNPVDKEQVEAIVQDYMAENPAAPGPAGPQGEPGKDGADGLPGTDGEDGITPHIGENGNWWIGETDTGKPSRGAPGEPGDDYVLTDADRQEIAEQAAGMVEVPDSGQNVNPAEKTEDMTQPVGVDENGQLWTAPTTSSGSGGGGIGVTAINLLIDILKVGMFTTNVSGKIESLKEALLAGSSGDSGGSGGGDSDGGTVADEITFADGVLTIVTVGSDVSVSDGIMTIL